MCASEVVRKRERESLGNEASVMSERVVEQVLVNGPNFSSRLADFDGD